MGQDRAINNRNARQIEQSYWLCVKTCLKEQWSPEQIASEVPISPETIDRHVYAGKAVGGDLYKSLRYQRKYRKRYAERRVRHWQILSRRPISDYKSGYAILAKVENKTADRVSTAIIERLKPIARQVQTLTYNNGKKFVDHAAIDRALGSTGYFADPHSSW